MDTAAINKKRATLEKFKGILDKYARAFEGDGLSGTAEQAQIVELQATVEQAFAQLEALEQQRTSSGSSETTEESTDTTTSTTSTTEEGESIDGVIPEQSNFSGSKEIDVEAVTRLFNEDKSVSDEYGEGISHDDVNQNWINDCFFLSALAAVAKANPEAIKNLIKGPLADGSYEVKLHIKGKKISLDGNPTIIKVFPKALEKDGQTTVGLGDNELWVLLVERAFAQAMGGYDVLDEAGFTEHGLEAITGKDAVYKETASMSNAEVVAFVQECIEKKVPLTASAKAVEPSLAEAAREAHIYLAHAYYVLGASGNTIQLRNPHNSDLPGGREVELEIDAFKQFFDYFDYTAFE